MTKAVEWMNQNAYRAFPFVEDSSGECTDGTVVPDWLILDAMKMYIGYNRFVSPPPHFMELVSFEFPFHPSTTGGDGWFQIYVRHNVRRPNGTIFSHDHIVYGVARLDTISMGTMASVNNAAEPSGQDFVKFSFGAPTSWSTVPDSFFGVKHVLKTPRPFLNSRCLFRPGGLGVSAFWVLGDNTTPVGPHKVLLRDGYNTTLRIHGGKIVLDVGKNIGLGTQCVNTHDDDLGGIYMIDGVHADSNGDFSIYGGPGISVSSGKYNDIPAVVVSVSGSVDSRKNGS